MASKAGPLGTKQTCPVSRIDGLTVKVEAFTSQGDIPNTTSCTFPLNASAGLGRNSEMMMYALVHCKSAGKATCFGGKAPNVYVELDTTCPGVGSLYHLKVSNQPNASADFAGEIGLRPGAGVPGKADWVLNHQIDSGLKKRFGFVIAPVRR